MRAHQCLEHIREQESTQPLTSSSPVPKRTHTHTQRRKKKNRNHHPGNQPGRPSNPDLRGKRPEEDGKCTRVRLGADVSAQGRRAPEPAEVLGVHAEGVRGGGRREEAILQALERALEDGLAGFDDAEDEAGLVAALEVDRLRPVCPN